MSKMDVVVPVKLSLGSKFKFKCHKAIKCFTKCCSNIDILLTPYDILRLKNRLRLSSGEFLSKYSYVTIDEKSSLPHVMLKMQDDEHRTCPFVTGDGCSVYTDRPANCRYYPIGQGTLKISGEKGPEDEEFYFFINEAHCLGYQEDKEWNIESWRIDQEAHLYDEMNRDWKAMQLRKNSPGQPELDDNTQAQIYLACYDLDRFRRFIFESRFLDTFEVDEETIKRIKSDESELMKFGFNYVKYIMRVEQTLKVKDGILESKKTK